MPMPKNQERKAFSRIANHIVADRPMDMDKNDLNAAVNAVFDLLNSPQFKAQLRVALPEPFRTRSSERDRQKILSIVAEMIAAETEAGR